MVSLPIIHTDDQALQLMQTRWSSLISPLLGVPLVNGNLIQASLINGVTVINHLLSRKQQGFIITDLNGAASIYRSQPLNDKTLTLTSNAAVNVALWCF